MRARSNAAMNLGALAAAIKKSNATLVTKNDLSAEEKLELKRKRRAELAADKLRREEIQAAILLQSIFRGKIYKRQAQKLRERKEFIETQATKYGKTKKYVSMLLRSVDSTDTLKFKYGYDDTIKLLETEKEKEYGYAQARKENTLHDELWPLLRNIQRKGSFTAEERRHAVLLLRRQGNDVINRPLWCDGRTILHRATYKRFSIVIKLMLSLGAIVDPKDTLGRQPIHIAAYYGDEENVILLLEHGVSANARDYEKTTPLHLACFEGRLETCKRLVEIGGAKLDSKDAHDVTPLHAAAYRGHDDVVEYLLQQFKARKNYGADDKKVPIRKWLACQTDRGLTPLMCASFYRHKDIMTRLVSIMNINELKLKDCEGYTASKHFQNGGSRKAVWEDRWHIRDPFDIASDEMC